MDDYTVVSLTDFSWFQGGEETYTLLKSALDGNSQVRIFLSHLSEAFEVTSRVACSCLLCCFSVLASRFARFGD